MRIWGGFSYGATCCEDGYTKGGAVGVGNEYDVALLYAEYKIVLTSTGKIEDLQYRYT